MGRTARRALAGLATVLRQVQRGAVSRPRIAAPTSAPLPLPCGGVRLRRSRAGRRALAGLHPCAGPRHEDDARPCLRAVHLRGGLEHGCRSPLRSRDLRFRARSLPKGKLLSLRPRRSSVGDCSPCDVPSPRHSFLRSCGRLRALPPSARKSTSRSLRRSITSRLPGLRSRRCATPVGRWLAGPRTRVGTGGSSIGPHVCGSPQCRAEARRAFAREREFKGLAHLHARPVGFSSRSCDQSEQIGISPSALRPHRRSLRTPALPFPARARDAAAFPLASKPRAPRRRRAGFVGLPELAFRLAGGALSALSGGATAPAGISPLTGTLRFQRAARDVATSCGAADVRPATALVAGRSPSSAP